MLMSRRPLICCLTIALMVPGLTFDFCWLPRFRQMEPVVAYLFKKSWVPCLKATSLLLTNILQSLEPLNIYWKNTICSFLYDEKPFLIALLRCTNMFNVWNVEASVVTLTHNVPKRIKR